jgi:hypothetical protein
VGLSQNVPCLISIFRSDDLIAPTLEPVLQKPAKNRVILRHEDGFGDIAARIGVQYQLPVMVNVADGISPESARVLALGYRFSYRD